MIYKKLFALGLTIFPLFLQKLRENILFPREYRRIYPSSASKNAIATRLRSFMASGKLK